MCAQIVFNIVQQARPKRRKHLRKERLAVENRVTVRTETALEENFRAFQEYVQPQSDYSLDRKCPLILRSAKRQVQLTLILEEKRQENMKDKRLTNKIVKEIRPFYAQIIELYRGLLVYIG